VFEDKRWHNYLMEGIVGIGLLGGLFGSFWFMSSLAWMIIF
jgi:hypothetical protein